MQALRVEGVTVDRGWDRTRTQDRGTRTNKLLLDFCGKCRQH